jgi:saccharopine dehydrogenase-like NADP-dependent oxidoreductase
LNDKVKMKKVLILGAGLVAKPIVNYLLENKIEVLIASPMKARADGMIGGNPLGSSADWSMDDPNTLERMVSEHDITVSLLPYKYHAEVAGICLNRRRSLVTTSYVQPGMMALDDAAKEAGILLLNEIGLDPGIDHMSAMRIIDRVHDSGGKVEEFYSLCGALPAPEAAQNPLGYKFSWSPRGVVLASLNSAVYLKKGEKKDIPSSALFKERFSFKVPGVGDLEVYPNRDSLSYMGIYGIPETKTLYRGTFRFRGWCESLDALKTLNMLDDIPGNYRNMSYSDFLADRAGIEKSDLRRNIARKLGQPESSVAIRSLDFLGFFGNDKICSGETTPFGITSGRMTERMMLADNERDMVILEHILLVSWLGGKREVIRSSMLDFGTPGADTSIARTVALPAAVAVKLILDNKIVLKGVHRPVIRQIYIPVLEELKKLGIEMKERWGLPGSEIDF